MNWYWKVHCYTPQGGYHTRQIKTTFALHEIDLISDFYHDLTGCRILLEGMSGEPYPDIEMITGLYAKAILP